MSPVNSSLDNPSFGLYRLHPEAFDAMSHFHHRVCSIVITGDPGTSTRFEVKTQCTNENNGGRKPCEGSIRFNLATQGPYLEVAELNHSPWCPKVALTRSTKHILQDRACNDPGFRTHFCDYLEYAFKLADLNLSNQSRKRQALEDEAYRENSDIPCTPHDVYEARALRDQIEELNIFVAEYYINH